MSQDRLLESSASGKQGELNREARTALCPYHSLGILVPWTAFDTLRDHQSFKGPSFYFCSLPISLTHRHVNKTAMAIWERD